MHEVEAQLGVYFDAVVERVTAEDVIARRQVTERRRLFRSNSCTQ